MNVNQENNLKRYREEAGFSKVKLAKLSGVSSGLIYKTEKGYTPRKEKMYEMARPILEKLENRIRFEDIFPDSE